jgi:hypothetical protein
MNQEKKKHGLSEVIKRFKSYTSEIHECYEDYLFQAFYLPHLHHQLKKDTVPVMGFETVYSNSQSVFKKGYLYGVISRQLDKGIGERALVGAVALTEDLLQDIIFRVYRDIPNKLMTDVEMPDQQAKMVRIIIDSVDIDEVVSRIAEEKIRGIFYGNPIDFFSKDKAKIGLGTVFKEHYGAALTQYTEIIARRNILTHNGGCVDRKYIREVQGTTLRLGQKVGVSKSYLKSSIRLLHGLSVVVLDQVVKNIYGASDLKERYKAYVRTFDKEYKDK